MDATNPNLAETLAKEMKQPLLVIEQGQMAKHQAVLALPPGWTAKDIDTSKGQPTPTRKLAKVTLQDADSFIEYTKRHGSLTSSTVWCDANYSLGKINLTAIINDHGDNPNDAAWRDHIAKFTPEFSQEWQIWTTKNAIPMDQLEFAAHIERNLKDITSAEGFPTGTKMFEMATNLEITNDSRFKSKANLDNGGVRLEYIDDADAETTQRMEIFKQFAIGLQVFRNGTAYQLTARLRYRIASGKLVFWYELVRPDITLEDAGRDLIKELRDKIGNPFFFGNPFA